jgi:hypothetical protein
MSQKSSVPQAVSFVSQALKRDNGVIWIEGGAINPPEVSPRTHYSRSVASRGAISLGGFLKRLTCLCVLRAVPAQRR